MATIYPTVYFNGSLVPENEAHVSVASSAVLYGLSVYTVFHVTHHDGEYFAFRIKDHYQRLVDSCRIIGIDTFAEEWSRERFTAAMSELLAANKPSENVFVRVSFHIADKLPGTRSRGLPAIMSAFIYGATPIIPQEGARLKTSVWRRTPDFSIPSRAKVNGAYVNSVLARQDAIDSGYDDCVFLDGHGHVTELSAANIFIVRGGKLLTPGTSSDILEGINRRTIIELAQELDIPLEERAIDLTELYIADEAFVCGTSAFISPIIEIDARVLPAPGTHPLTNKLSVAYKDALLSPDSQFVTKL